MYYLWAVRSAGYPFDWSRDQSGYYNYLGRAFAHGRLSLEIVPEPALLALPNPWDPIASEPYRMHDMVLYQGRYYLYHGAGPAVMLFAPWRAIFGRDLPERFALFLFCFGGFVFSCGTLLRWLSLGGVKTSPPLVALMLLALGLCQSVPYLLSRVWVYEVAIGSGYFCIAGAVFFFARGNQSKRSGWWLAASGLMFGLAVSCRPHLIFAGTIAALGLLALPSRSRGLRGAMFSREWIAFAGAFAFAGTVLAAYNYLRFGNPFEFGLQYILAGPNQNRIRLAGEYLLPGLYFFLACPPDLSLVFPWIHLAFRQPFDSMTYAFPPGYFIESTAGSLFLAPFAAAAAFVPSAHRMADSALRMLLWTALAFSIVLLLFLSATGFTTQRYEVDFVPMVLLVALANFAIHIDRAKGILRATLQAALIFSIAYGAVSGIALGIGGPYDEMLKNRPKSYVRIARWFSPIEQFRPVMNPRIDIAFTAEFAQRPEPVHEPLLTIGRYVYRYFLYVDHTSGNPRLVSKTESSTVVRDLGPGDKQRAETRVTYRSGRVTVVLNGREFLVHEIGTLVAAPSEVTVAENRADWKVTVQRFTGRVYDVVRR